MFIDKAKFTDKESVDVIITTVPWTESSIPLMAPAVLKPIVEKAGFSCLAIDLNAEICHNLKKENNIDDYITFFFDEKCANLEVQSHIQTMLVSSATFMTSMNPKFIGISVFSYVNRVWTSWLCYFIKKINPNIKIIIGGAGCLEQFTGPAYFADELLAAGLADYHIRGDGENALYELLTGNVTYTGINDTTWTQLDNAQLSKLPMPDYSDYNFNVYEKKALCLQGSRGCVRSCKFCDYIENWSKFQWRTADDIFNEMQTQYKKHQIRTFKFQDTLTNGNLKEFDRLVDLLADYNSKNPDVAFRWGGYYIFRDRTLSDNQRWQKLKQSGADMLIVGIESLDEQIRYDIGKKFSNASIDYHLDRALEYNIRIQLLFITGYVTETQQHIDYRKHWLENHVMYQPIIYSIQWGGGLGIFPNTYLHRNKEQLGIQMIGAQPHLWINSATGSNPRQRAQWVNELNDYSEKLGYVVEKDVDNHYLLERSLNVAS
jgi:hypothetical protein